MDKVCINGLMGTNTKENGLKIKEKGKAFLFKQMEINMMDNGNKICGKDMD